MTREAHDCTITIRIAEPPGSPNSELRNLLLWERCAEIVRDVLETEGVTRASWQVGSQKSNWKEADK